MNEKTLAEMVKELETKLAAYESMDEVKMFAKRVIALSQDLRTGLINHGELVDRIVAQFACAYVDYYSSALFKV